MLGFLRQGREGRKVCARRSGPVVPGGWLVARVGGRDGSEWLGGKLVLGENASNGAEGERVRCSAATLVRSRPHDGLKGQESVQPVCNQNALIPRFPSRPVVVLISAPD